MTVLFLVARTSIENSAIQSAQSSANIIGESIVAELDLSMLIATQINNNAAINSAIVEMIDTPNIFEENYQYVYLSREIDELRQALIDSSIDAELLVHIIDESYQYYSHMNSGIDVTQLYDQIQLDIELLSKNNSENILELARTSYSNSEQDVIYFYIPHYPLDSNIANYYIIVGMPKAYIESAFLPLLNDNNTILLYNDEDRLIYSSEQLHDTMLDLIDTDIDSESYEIISHDSKEYIYTAQKLISGVEWTQIQIIERSVALAGLNGWIYLFVLTVIVLALFGLIVSIYVNKNIVSRIELLDNDIQLIKSGGKVASERIIDDSDEIGRLSKHFYSMIEEINRIQHEMILKETQKHQLEVESLQSQINPHFIYNTIGGIKILLMLKKYDEVASSLSALVRILKNSVAKADATIALIDEVTLLKSYIFIQQMRYCNFNITIDLPKELEQLHIMRFLIQPLIENSLLHGYEEVNEYTSLSVAFRSFEETVVVTVSDNGIGMSDTQLNDMLSYKIKSEGLNGIGIYNIKRRIELNYTEPCGMDIQTSIGNGTTIILTLPKILGGRQE